MREWAGVGVDDMGLRPLLDRRNCICERQLVRLCILEMKSAMWSVQGEGVAREWKRPVHVDLLNSCRVLTSTLRTLGKH